MDGILDSATDLSHMPKHKNSIQYSHVLFWQKNKIMNWHGDLQYSGCSWDSSNLFLKWDHFESFDKNIKTKK